MIIDRLENAELYQFNNALIRTAIDYLRRTDFTKLSPGQYDIQDEDCYVMLSEYKTRDRTTSKLEGHRRYIDVQYLIEGHEQMGYEPLSNQSVHTEYSDEYDYALFEGEPSFTHFEQGMFAIFFPHDLHMPGVGNGENTVKKAVVKVRVK